MNVLIKYGIQLLGFKHPYKKIKVFIWVDDSKYQLTIDTRDNHVDSEEVEEIVSSVEDSIISFDDVNERNFGVNPKWTVVEYNNTVVSPFFEKILTQYFQKVDE